MRHADAFCARRFLRAFPANIFLTLEILWLSRLSVNIFALLKSVALVSLASAK